MEQQTDQLLPEAALLSAYAEDESVSALSSFLIKKVIEPLSTEERRQMREYFYYYLPHEKEFRGWAEEELKDHPVFGKILTGIPKHLRDAQNEISIKLQRKAIMENDWFPYAQNLIRQGMAYAKMGLQFYAWYEVTNLLKKFLIPKILNENGDSAFSAISGMNRFLDVAMSFIGEAYLFEKKRIAEEEKKKTEHLNKQLEQFAYLASHDLKEPLQTIKSFVQLLETEIEKTAPELARQYLGYIKSSIDRMNLLIISLLNYSRLGKSGSLQMVDLNKVLAEVSQDLKASIERDNAQIKTELLPSLVAYPAEIKQLFQNLLSNAIKFRKKNQPPRIEISVKKENDGYHFTMKDNGIGIDKKHHTQIFEIFSRLHSATEYSGSGIGLSYCKKIAELHNGDIWVESEVGKGSVFHVLLPAKQ